MLRDGKVKRTTLCFIFDGDKLLMIEKRRGQGAGKWNMPGGKIAEGENPASAAIRECEEETGIRPLGVREAGVLEFYFTDGASWDNICTVFVADRFTGTLLGETEECFSHWVPVSEIPYDRMWDDDRHWLPQVFTGKRFHRIYRFRGDKMESEEIVE